MTTPNRATTPRIYLRCAAMFVAGDAVLADPVLSGLAADDLSWQLHWEDWLRRQPRGWQWRRLRHWKAEGQDISTERERLRVAIRGHRFGTG
jgi:hypothetical protein